MLVILIVNILCLIGSLCAAYHAYKQANDAHTYCDGAHESTMAAGGFMNRAEAASLIAKISSSKAEEHAAKAQIFSPTHEMCSTCKSQVARFEKSEDGSVKCFNCK
jgi:hypothetical protein